MNLNIFAGLTRISAPSAEPVSVDEVNTFLNLQPVGVDARADAFLGGVIQAARQYLETTVLKRALLKQTWELYLKTWPGRDYVNSSAFSGDMLEYVRHNHIKIPFPPLRVINSINYINTSGQTKSVTPYDPPVSTLTQGAVNVFKNLIPAKIVLPFSGVWPTDILMPGAPITINFDCGYTDLDDLIKNFEGYGPFRQGLYLICADAWENRIPPSDINNRAVMNTVETWLEPYRVYEN